MKAGLKEDFLSLITATNETYHQIKGVASHVASYIVTNAHRRRLLMKVNARELYHIARLRMDSHAQWDIRETVTRMVTQAQEKMPLTMMLACGRDAFPSAYSTLFSKKEEDDK